VTGRVGLGESGRVIQRHGWKSERGTWEKCSQVEGVEHIGFRY
jgi:hypothetical protein